MRLVITEKPNTAKIIAAAMGAASRIDDHYEGNGLIVSWCMGHLVSPMDAAGYNVRYKKWNYDDLPILPTPFRFVLAPGKSDAFETLKTLMARQDVDTVINACDAGREGELIFRLVYEMAGCRKPVQRLWISSMEERAIRESFSELRPGLDYDPLYQAALCRLKADWLVGINATRLFSVLYHRTLNVGRVQTPTLKMLVDRDWAIQSFKGERYYRACLSLDGIDAFSERISSKDIADKIVSECSGQAAVCTGTNREYKKEQPPKLYDLTTLQREANRLLGYTAKQTLEYAQSLYEKKLLTYPRTDSRHLPSDMAETASLVLHAAAKMPPFDRCNSFYPDVSILISDKKVSDHHAIIPTPELENINPKRLLLGERNILGLVCCKSLCAAAEPCCYEIISTAFDCSGHSFTAKETRITTDGWREIDRCFRRSINNIADKSNKNEPFRVIEGQIFNEAPVSAREYITAPPEPYTEDTLLQAMERAGAKDTPENAGRKGLGTPATRAAIIEKLISAGLAERRGKDLIPTKTGINLVAVLPEALTSPVLTAEWEQQLYLISQNRLSPDLFVTGIASMVQELVQTYSHISEDAQALFSPGFTVIGKCPRCGAPVYEGKKNFFCSDRACTFVLWKQDHFWTTRKKELTRQMAEDLLNKGRIRVNGMWSPKTSSMFDGVVILDDVSGKFIKFRIEPPPVKADTNDKE